MGIPVLLRAMLVVVLFGAGLLRAQTTWLGTVSSNWGDPANWSSVVPGQTTDATVAAAPFQPDTSGVPGATCRNLTVTAGASLIIGAGFPLAIQGTAIVGGTIQAFDTTLAVAVDLTVQNGGLLNAPAAQASIGRTLVVANTGSLTLGPGPHSVGGSLTVNGALTVPPFAILQLTSTGIASPTASGNLANVDLIYSGAPGLTFTATTLHSLLQQPGGGTITINNPVHVLQDASFLGANLGGGSSLVVDGNLTVQCAAVVATPPNITLAGNLTASNGNFQPTVRTVTFVGAVPQTITMPVLSFFNLTIDPTAVVTAGNQNITLNNLVVHGSLTTATNSVVAAATIDVDGSLSLAAVASIQTGSFLRAQSTGNVNVPLAQLNVGTDLIVNVNATLTAGAGPHTVGSSVAATGNFAVPGGTTLQMTSSTSTGPSVSGGMPNVALIYSGASILGAANATVRSLQQQAGAGRITVNNTLHVLQDASFLGADLGGGGSLVVDGNLTVQCAAVVATPPNITLSGNLTATNGNFQPTVRTVTFVGTAPQTIAMPVLSFFNLTIDPTAVVTAGNQNITVNNLVVHGSLTTATNSVVAAATIDVDGSLSLAAVASMQTGSFLRAQNTGNVNVPLAQLNVGTDLIVNVNATLTAGAGPHTVGSSVTAAGNFAVPGGTTLQMTSSTSTGPSVSGGMPNVALIYSGASILGAANATVRSLQQQAGAGRITVNNTLQVLQDASFLGAVLGGGGSLVVDGNLTVQCSSVVATPPNITLAGNLTATNGNFQPTTRTVTFVGTAPQSIAMPVLSFFNLTIDTSAVVTAGNQNIAVNNLLVRGSLTTTTTQVVATGSVDVFGALNLNAVTSLQTGSYLWARNGGSISLPLAQLNLGGNLSIDATGAISAGVGPHTVGGSVDVGNNFTVPVGTTLLMTSSGSTLPLVGGDLSNVDLSYSGSPGLFCSAFTAHTLQQLAGAGNLFVNGTVHVLGDASLLGASINGGSGFVIDGNLTMQFQNVVTQPPGITLSGNLTANNGNFQPTGGTVVMVGTAPQTITMPALTFNNLTIETTAAVTAGSQNVAVNNLVVRGSLTTTTTQVVATGLVDVFGVLSLNSVTSLQTGSYLWARGGGSISLPLAQLNLGGHLTVDATGSLSASAGPHTVGGSVNVGTNFTVPTGTTLLMTSSGSSGPLVGGDLGNVDLSYSGSPGLFCSAFTAHTLQQLAGAGNLFVNGPIHVLQDASLLGANINGGSLLDVDANLTIECQTVVTSPPNITVGGNFTATNGNFQPTSGTITFDGTGTQTVQSTNLLMSTATINSGSNLVLQVANLTVQQDLTVNGTMTTPSSSLQVQRDLIVAAAGQVTVGQGTHTVARNLTVNGLTTGAGKMVMTGPGTLSGTGTVQNMEVASSGTVTATSASTGMTVTGAFELSDGTLSIAANKTLQINGAATFSGGTLAGGANSTLDLNSAAVFSGTFAAAALPAIFCAGDWTADTSFQPSTGTVFFDPSGIARLGAGSAGGAIYFNAFEVTSGTVDVSDSVELHAPGGTVRPGGTLDVGASSMPTSTIILTSHGTLRLRAGGTMILAPGSRIVVSSTGTLALIGTPSQPARILGSQPGAFSIDVQGQLAAYCFELRNLDCYRSSTDRGGVRLLAGATLGAPPYDFCSGVLEATATNANAALLWLGSGVSYDLHDLDFENSGTTSFKNVATTEASPLQHFVRYYDGNLGGAAFEDDPNNIVQWLSAGRTTLSSLSARGGVNRVTVEFASDHEVDTTAFRVFGASLEGGPFTELVGSPITATGSPTAGATYAITDTGVAAMSRRYYEVYDDRPGMSLRLLGTTSGRAWSSQVGSCYFVGPGGYADIPSAVAAAPDGASIAVAGGTYASFTISRPMHIFADGSGPVVIDTTAGKLTVRDLSGLNTDFVLRDVSVGAANGLYGLELLNCDAVVVLDEVDVSVGATATALRIDDCPRVSLQQVTLQGGVALELDNAATVYASGCSVPSLQVANVSRLVGASTVVGTQSVDPTSSATALAGSVPRLASPATLVVQQLATLTINSDPFDFYVLFIGGPRSFIDLSFLLPIDMVLLLDPAASVNAASGLANAAGVVDLPIRSPDIPGVWGLSLGLQVVVMHTTTLTGRFGGVRDLVIVP